MSRRTEYEGPEGHGWVLRAETVVDGVLYRRAVNVGPEDWRAQEWTEVVPFVPPRG